MKLFTTTLCALLVSVSVVAFTTLSTTSSNPFMFRPLAQRVLVRTMATKPGVATVEELHSMAQSKNLVVIDVRNPDASVEPGDQKSLAVAPLPSKDVRPNALHLIWDRNQDNMPLPPKDVAKDTPIITHCGGGGRGQKAKDFLEENGFTNVLNGGGPKLTEHWAEYGDK